MIFSLSCNIEGIYGPCGAVSESLPEILNQAVSFADVALDQLDDFVNLHEWYELAGEDADVRALLQSTDPHQILGALTQIGDSLKSKDMGWLDVQDHDDLFALVAHHEALGWASDSFNERLAELRKSYTSLISHLSHDWDAA